MFSIFSSSLYEIAFQTDFTRIQEVIGIKVSASNKAFAYEYCKSIRKKFPDYIVFGDRVTETGIYPKVSNHFTCAGLLDHCGQEQ